MTVTHSSVDSSTKWSPIGVARSFDRRLTAPGSARTLVQMRTAFVLIIGMRLLLRDWWLESTTPKALFEPVMAVRWLSGPPSSTLVTVLWVVGLVAVVATVAGRWAHFTFVVAWAALLVLCAVWSSSGKVMHNDILLLWGSAPFLFAQAPSRAELDAVDERWGWPPRAALIVVATIYFVAGAQKIRHSGLRWVFSDNLSWVLRQGTSPLPFQIGHTLAPLVWLTAVVSGITLVMELGAPILLGVRKFRLGFLLLAITLHGSIWLTMGLDYYGWILTVAAVTIPMSPLGDWWRQRRFPPRGVDASESPDLGHG